MYIWFCLKHTIILSCLFVSDTVSTGAPVDLSDESIHVLGALLKDFLRSVPGGILMSSRYTEFVATNDITDIHARVQHIQR